MIRRRHGRIAAPRLMQFVSSFSSPISCILLFAARHGGFREDEMMNLWMYWYVGPVQSLFALAKFWTPYYRPGGALYYLPLYHFFGLNPFPYRIVQISILALSIPHRLLSGPTSRLFPLGRVPCGSCFLLPSICSKSGIRWSVHLRRVMRLVLSCCIDLLRPYPEERGLPSSVAANAIPGAIYLCAQQQGDGGYPSGHRFDLRAFKVTALA